MRQHAFASHLIGLSTLTSVAQTEVSVDNAPTGSQHVLAIHLHAVAQPVLVK